MHLVSRLSVFASRQTPKSILLLHRRSITSSEPFPLWKYLDCDKRDHDPIKPGVVQSIAKAIDESDVTDLIVVSHGWRNSYNEAASSYKKLAANIAAISGENGLPDDDVKLGLIGIRWPSLVGDKRNPNTFEIIPDKRDEVSMLSDEIEELIEYFPSDKTALREVQATLQTTQPQLKASKSAAEEHHDSGFAEAMAKLFDTGHSNGTNYDDAKSTGEIDTMSSIKDEILHLSKKDAIDYLGWHRSKTRAAETGLTVVSPAIREIRALTQRDDFPKLHMVGHSFGALLVAASASGLRRHEQYDSMTLLQAAFSHNAFSQHYDFTGHPGPGPGMFHDILKNEKIRGPFVATHTSKDGWLGRQPFGLWPYTNRARAFGENGRVIPKDKAASFTPSSAKRVDDDEGHTNPDDEYGAIGANGAQNTDELVQHFPSTYGGSLHQTKFNNVQGHDDQTIMISGHSDVWNKSVAKLILDVIRRTQ